MKGRGISSSSTIEGWSDLSGRPASPRAMVDDQRAVPIMRVEGGDARGGRRPRPLYTPDMPVARSNRRRRVWVGGGNMVLGLGLKFPNFGKISLFQWGPE